MVDETLVEALERAGVPLHKSVFVSGLNLPTRITVALDDASTLLPIMVAHATPEERAALLRTLLGERLDQMARPSISDVDGNPGEPVVLVTSRRGWSGINVEPDHLLNLLAPEVRP